MVNRDAYVLVSFLVGIFLVGISFAYFTFQVADIEIFTGNSIKSSVDTFYETSSVGQRILIFSMIILSFAIISIAILLILKKFKKRVIISKKNYEKEGGKRSRTDLDTLYAILKDKKSVGMEDIEATFKIDPEIALGWSKILEDGELAEIEYPRFGKPVLRLIEGKVSTGEVKKDMVKEEEKEGDEKEGGEKIEEKGEKEPKKVKLKKGKVAKKTKTKKVGKKVGKKVAKKVGKKR